MPEDGPEWFSLSESLCFTGHRIIPETEKRRIIALLPAVLEEYYLQGKRVFLSGGALGFDTLAAEAVLGLKKNHPDVRMVIAAPCRDQSVRWNASEQKAYLEMISSADQVLYISDTYFPGCMQKRNRFLVDHADTCLCYLVHCRGGTWNTVSYAYDMNLRIRNLAVED